MVLCLLDPDWNIKLLDELEANNIQSGGDRRVTKKVASLKEDSSAQIAAILSAMNKRFDILESQVQRKKTPGCRYHLHM